MSTEPRNVARDVLAAVLPVVAPAAVADAILSAVKSDGKAQDVYPALLCLTGMDSYGIIKKMLGGIVMTEQQKKYYAKRGAILVKNLQNRHFGAHYCDSKEEALAKALELIPVGSSVSWGGALSADQIGLTDAVKCGNYRPLLRENCTTQEERENLMRQAMVCDVFLTGANAMRLDGQMVNIDGTGNRLAAICYGPKQIIVIAGMNKVEDNLDAAIRRARTVAAPMNKQRFPTQTPCEVTGTCADCKVEGCICNQILVTRHCRPVGRIQFIIVGEALGF